MHSWHCASAPCELCSCDFFIVMASCCCDCSIITNCYWYLISLSCRCGVILFFIPTQSLVFVCSFFRLYCGIYLGYLCCLMSLGGWFNFCTAQHFNDCFFKKQVSKVVWNYDGAISGWNIGSISIGCLVHLVSSVAYGGHPGCIDHFY